MRLQRTSNEGEHAPDSRTKTILDKAETHLMMMGGALGGGSGCGCGLTKTQLDPALLFTLVPRAAHVAAWQQFILVTFAVSNVLF